MFFEARLEATILFDLSIELIKRARLLGYDSTDSKRLPVDNVLLLSRLFNPLLSRIKRPLPFRLLRHRLICLCIYKKINSRRVSTAAPSYVAKRDMASAYRPLISHDMQYHLHPVLSSPSWEL